MPTECSTNTANQGGRDGCGFEWRCLLERLVKIRVPQIYLPMFEILCYKVVLCRLG